MDRMHEDRLDAIRALMDTRQGRALLWWLLDIGLVDKQPHTGNALNTSFNCGQLNVGLQVKGEIETAVPGGVARIAEAMERDYGG